MPGKTRPNSRSHPFNGAPLVPGNPGNSGGKRGRSGRKPQDFLNWCRGVTDDPVARQVYEARNRSGDIRVLKLAAEYAHGKPAQSVEHQGEVTVRVTYDAD
jgi:hypothetical protein